jgi:hypothetical protein
MDILEQRVFRAGFKGKPPPTKRDEFDLPCVVVVPTPIDKAWNFCDAPAKDDSEYLDMLQYPSDTRTPQQRLAGACTFGNDRNYDSQEIGIQCFDGNGWPDKTDLKCWWCLHRFDARPFPCPVFKNREGVLRIRGVFCGPSCAKAWALIGSRFPNPSYVENLIYDLAHKRGYFPPEKKFHYIPAAPPRETLAMFCGPEGLTIDQFRGLCASGFDVNVLHPPYITEKQVIVAECERMSRISRTGRLVHIENVDSLMVPAAEFVRRRREGLEIFAGVGAKRLTDFIGKPPPKKPNRLPPADFSPQTSAAAATTPVKNGRVKRPLPPADPQAIPPAKRQRTARPPPEGSRKSMIKPSK